MLLPLSRLTSESLQNSKPVSS
ncbi:hypothetical protein DVH24_025210 [Malus domestica]|uniref:Uncharacterized protein n=1 Tax=Malus domestica TaxID=3750 RepID=A0A498HLB4_MALDO|nr:hypothetical protein DVH24_025210 [Malus domestica]